MKNISDNAKLEKTRIWIKWIVLLLFVIGLPAYLYIAHGDFIRSFKTVEDVVSFINSNKGQSALVFFGIQLLQVVVAFLPGEVFQMAAGYLFGPFEALLIALSGCVLGSTIDFFLAKYLGRDFIHLFIGEEKTEKYSEMLNSSKAMRLCFVLYLIPGIPKDIVNYAAGASDMRFKPFIVISSLARIPGMLGSIIMGYLIAAENPKAAIIVGVVALIILIVSYIFRDKLVN